MQSCATEAYMWRRGFGLLVLSLKTVSAVTAAGFNALIQGRSSRLENLF